MKSLDIGANLFIGNLDPEIDEKMLYDIFSAFGVILQAPKVREREREGESTRVGEREREYRNSESRLN